MNQELPELPEDIAELLQVEHDLPAEPPEKMDRVWRQLEDSLPAPIPDATDSSPAASSGVNPGKFGSQALGASFVAGVLAGGLAVYGLQEPEVVIRERVKTVVVEKEVPQIVHEPVKVEIVAPKKATKTKKLAAKKPQVAAKLELERRLLERARVALGRGKAEEALQALDKHRRNYAKSRFREERAALTILANSSLGKKDLALKQARSFFLTYPQSLFAPQIRKSLGPQ